MADTYGDAILALSPVAYWPLDDVGVWGDASGRGHTLTASGSVGSTSSLRAGTTRTAADLTGGYLSTPDTADLRFESMTSGFTVTLTHRWDTDPGTLWFLLDKEAANDGFSIWHDSTAGKPIKSTMNGTSGVGGAVTTTVKSSTSSATVYHTTVVYDPSTNDMLSYVNGVLDNTYDVSAWPGWLSTSTSGVALLLGGSNNVPSFYKLDGAMQDVAIYDYPLSADQVAALYSGIVVGKGVERPSGGSLRDALQRITNSNAGRFFAAKDGTLTLQWRDAEANKSTALTLNSDQTSPWVSGVQLAPGFTDVVSDVVLRLADGTEIRAQASERTALTESVSLTIDTALVDAGDGEDLAQFLADYSARPSRVVRELSASPQAWSSYDPVLAALLELGDRVSVNLPGGDTFDGTVERIAWDFDGAATLRLGLDRYDPGGFGNANWFTLDGSALDGADVLAY